MVPYALYPISLVVAGRPCLVVGGGRIAARKAEGLARSGAQVTVVAPVVDASIDALPVLIERRRYRVGEAASYRLVITATGVPEVDATVAHDAEGAGVWVNSADDAAHCTFMLPAIHRDGPVTVAVSTGGASPALASWLRDRLAAACGTGLGSLAGLLDDTRGVLQAAGRATGSVDWQAILDGPVPELVRDGHLDDARRQLERSVRHDSEEDCRCTR